MQDLFASKCEDEQEISAANSAAVNKAYQTLVEPMSRVKYLVRSPFSDRFCFDAASLKHKIRRYDWMAPVGMGPACRLIGYAYLAYITIAQALFPQQLCAFLRLRTHDRL